MAFAPTSRLPDTRGTGRVRGGARADGLCGLFRVRERPSVSLWGAQCEAWTVGDSGDAISRLQAVFQFDRSTVLFLIGGYRHWLHRD